MDLLIRVIHKMQVSIKTWLTKNEIRYKRFSWKKSGNIHVDESVLVFAETFIGGVLNKMITVDDKSCIRGFLEVQRDGGCIHIGKRCYVGDGTRIFASQKIEIGNDVLIAHNCNIFDNDTHPVDLYERRKDAENIIWNGRRERFSSLKEATIIIEDDVWIGCNSTILKGVTIGKGSVIAAGSVVTKSVPAKVVVGGNPSKILKHIEQDSME